MKRLIVLLLVVAAQAAGEPPDRKAVMALMRLVLPKSSYTGMIDQMATQMVAQLKQSGQQTPPDLAERVRDAVFDVAPYEENLAWAADIYQKRFTSQEIADLRKFYESPTGKKFAKALPEIGGDLGRLMGEIIPQRMPAALKKHGLAP